MSWYILQCRTGQEEMIIRSCRQHLSAIALEEAFYFRCERLWRSDGVWKRVEKKMFPGYVFLESGYPELLSKELEQFRKILRVLEEPGYMISVYDEEEQNLRKLCGNQHTLQISYGYREDGEDVITEGPLKGKENEIIRFDWHRRFAQMNVAVGRHSAVVWAGLDLDESMVRKKNTSLVS